MILNGSDWSLLDVGRQRLGNVQPSLLPPIDQSQLRGLASFVSKYRIYCPSVSIVDFCNKMTAFRCSLNPSSKAAAII